MDRLHGYIISTLWTVLTLWINGCYTELREYCFPNAFNATCPVDHVIVLSSARYGRMSRGGKCLTSDYNVGCWADVLPQLDRRCSGRRHCSVTIPDMVLHNLQPCQKDLLAYLEADYICQKVESRPTSSSCRFYGDLVVEIGGGISSGQASSTLPSSGYLANIITEEHGFGSARCPWLVTAPRGQRINLTLFDFGLAGRHDGASGVVVTGSSIGGVVVSGEGGHDVGGGSALQSNSVSTCHVYAKVTETGTSSLGVATEITICGSRSRQRVVYVSESSRLEVVMTSFKLDEEPVYFLLKYEAIGCSDPSVPRGATMRRSGEKAMIACNATSQTWHIVCQGSQWYGKVDNCTTSAGLFPKTSNLSLTARDRFPYGLPVAVVTGLVVGVLLGVAMLAVVIACLKRRKIPALRCAHDFLNGTPMVALTPTTAYLTSSGADKYSTGGNLMGPCSRPDHHQYFTASGNTGGGPVNMSCSVAAEYGYTHICGSGTASGNIATQTPGTVGRQRQSCELHRHLHRQGSTSNSSLDRPDDFRPPNGDVINGGCGGGNPSRGLVLKSVQSQQQLHHHGTAYDMPGGRGSTSTTPVSKPTDFRAAPPPPLRRVGMGWAGSSDALNGVSTKMGGDESGDNSQQVMRHSIQGAVYCPEFDLIASADQDDLSYWSGVAA